MACIVLINYSLHASTLYEHDFSKGDGGWESMLSLLDKSQIPKNHINCTISWLGLYACTIHANIIDGNNQLKSPWMLDKNHAYPGAGDLNLLTWFRPQTPIDISNAILEIDMATKDLNLKGGKLVFWFQTTTVNRKYANFALTGMPIEIPSDGKYRRVVLDLSKKQNWTCLGSSVSRSDTYECKTIEEAARNLDVNFGFIIFPVSGSPDPKVQPSGTINIRSIKISTKDKSA